MSGSVPAATGNGTVKAGQPTPGRRVLTGTHYMNGDLACAEGAVAAGCSFFAGYPITPSTEIAERLARRLPEVGAVFVQMEDELASIGAVLGAAWGGARALTATSGPGFTLMMENIGWGMLTETPCVVVDVQRGGPATGLPTLVSQGDVMQAKWGSHGDYEPVALTPSSPQEMFELTIKAFAIAERLRQPVFLLADEAVAHMTERVTIPPAEEIEVPVRRSPATVSPDGTGSDASPGANSAATRFLPFGAGPDLVPPMPRAGDGFKLHVTGLTHDERGYPSTDAVTHDRLVRRLSAKVQRAAADLVMVEQTGMDDAEVVVIAYGGAARSAQRAVKLARESGLRAGLFRPITLWPFPEEQIAALGRRNCPIVVAEMNLGQVAREVERFVRRPVRTVTHGGGLLLPPDQILDALRDACREGR